MGEFGRWFVKRVGGGLAKGLCLVSGMQNMGGGLVSGEEVGW